MRSPPPAPPRRSALFPRSPRTCRGRRARSAHARSHLPIAGSLIVAADVVDLGFGDVIVDLRMLHPAGEKCRTRGLAAAAAQAASDGLRADHRVVVANRRVALAQLEERLDLLHHSVRRPQPCLRRVCGVRLPPHHRAEEVTIRGTKISKF